LCHGTRSLRCRNSSRPSTGKESSRCCTTGTDHVCAQGSCLEIDAKKGRRRQILRAAFDPTIAVALADPLTASCARRRSDRAVGTGECSAGSRTRESKPGKFHARILQDMEGRHRFSCDKKREHLWILPFDTVVSLNQRNRCCAVVISTDDIVRDRCRAKPLLFRCCFGECHRRVPNASVRVLYVTWTPARFEARGEVNESAVGGWFIIGRWFPSERSEGSNGSL
jgi:hypothetical protein